MFSFLWYIRSDGNVVLKSRITDQISMGTIKYFPWEVAAHLRSFFEKVDSLPRVFIVNICAHTFPRPTCKRYDCAHCTCYWQPSYRSILTLDGSKVRRASFYKYLAYYFRVLGRRYKMTL